MADVKISELTAKGSAVSTNDLFETSVSGTATNSVTGQNFVDLVGADNLASIVSEATARSNIGAQTQSTVLDNTTASFTTADETKLDGIEAGADVTDTANVTSAGAAMLTGADFTGDISTTGNLTVSGTAATVTSGTGTPEGSKTAAIGSVFMRTDGTTDTSLYRKETGTGSTGWVAVTAGTPGGNETLAQTLALGNTSGANDLLMASGQKVTTNTIDETTSASGVTIDSVLVKDSTVTAGTLTIGAGSVTDSSGAITFGNENLTTTGNVDANGVEFDSLSGTGAVAVTDILDEDNMASNSATMLATQQSIKAYVDASSSGAPEGTAVLSTGETGTSKFLRVDGDGTSSWQIPPTSSGDITAVIAGTGISGGGTTGDVTITNDAPNIVQTTVTGNAGSATVLQTARTIAGVSFDGSANISLNNNAITNGAGYTTTPAAGSSSIVTTGALNSGSITSGFGTINNGASTITTTGVITGGTVEATTDTAAGDNAAMGYTAAEGLILTGQGSSNDVTIKNDADATVMSIATGTTNATFAGDVTLSNASSPQIVLTDTTNSNTLQLIAGNTISAIGTTSTHDLALRTNGIDALEFDGTTQNATFAGDVTVDTATGGILTLKRSDTDVTTGDVFGQIDFDTTDTTNAGTAVQIRGEATGTSANGEFYVATATAGVLTDQLHIDKDGLATFAGDVTTDGRFVGKGAVGTVAASTGVFTGRSTGGGTMGGSGSSKDISILNKNNTQCITVPTGTNTVEMHGAVDIAGDATFAGDVNIASGGTLDVADGITTMSDGTGNIPLVLSSTDTGVAISFQDDTTTSTGSQIGAIGDVMFIKTTGVEAVNFDASQNATFAGDVTLSNTATPTITITDTTNTCSLAMLAGNNSANIGTTTATHDLVIKAGGSTAITLDGTTQASTFAGNVTHGSAAYVTQTNYGTNANSRIITGGTNTATGYLAVAQWNGSAYVNTVSFSGSDSATTFAGDVTVDNGNTPLLTLRSASQAWAGGEDVGGIEWFNEDASGIGQHNIATITVENNGASTTPTADIVFSGSAPNALPHELLRLDARDDIATFAGDVIKSGVTGSDVTLTGGRQAVAFTPAGVIDKGIQISTGYASGTGNYGHTGLTMFGDADNYAGVYVQHDNASDAKLTMVSNNTVALTLDSSQNATFAGTITGNGSGLTTLNGSNISTGTVAAARVATLNQNTTGSSGSCTGNAATASAAVLIKVNNYTGSTNMRILGSHQTGGSDNVYSNSSMYLNCNTGIINAAGFYASGNITAYSDKRVKTNFEVIPNALEKVSKLSGYTFDRTDLEDEDGNVKPVARQTGVVAQEVLEVLPEAVSQNPKDGMYGVAYGNMVGLLIEAIKELKAEVEELKGNK